MRYSEDKEYVEGLKNNDLKSFNALFYKYSEHLYAFALSITRSNFAAEEITQLVFLKVWEKREQIDLSLTFKSFLFTIAYNETISWLRSEKSKNRIIHEFFQSSDQTSNETEFAVEFNDIEKMAVRFIEALPDKRREIFKLSREQGLSTKEIARELGISEKTVENQMSSALKYLRKKLNHFQIFGLIIYLSLFY